MSEEIVRITGIQPKSENTASSGIGNAEFSDFVKTYEKKHEAMMNLVASTSNNAFSIYNNIVKSIDTLTKKQVSFSNAIVSALSTNNALAQSASEAILQGISKVSSSLDIIGELVLDIAIPKVNPEEELAKQIMNKMIIDNKSYISKWKLDELDAMMHPSKAKKRIVAPAPQAAPGSSVAAEMYTKLDEFYTLFDIYTDDASEFQRVTLKTLQDMYALGDLESDHTVDVTSSMSHYIRDTYTLLDLWTDDQSLFNRQVLAHLGNIEERLNAAKELGKTDNSSHVSQANSQKFGINNKQTNIGIDKSIKMNYTGNIDVRAIKELLESKAIFNPAKIAMVKMMFKTVAKSIADGLTDIRAVLAPKVIGKDGTGGDIFDNPVKTIEATSTLIQTITSLASLTGNNVKKSHNLGLFGQTLYEVDKQSQLISNSNTKKLSNFFRTISKSIHDGFIEIEKATPSQQTVAAVQNISDMITAITGLIQPQSKERSFELFGKQIFFVSSPQNLGKEIDSFKKTFKKLTGVFVDLYRDISKIDVKKDKIEGISDTIQALTEVISRNTISVKDALGFRIIGGGLSSIFKSIAKAKVNKRKGKNIADILGWILPIISPNKISPKDGIGLVIAGTGIGNFFKNINGIDVNLKTAKNIALTLESILPVIYKNKISPKDGLAIISVGQGLSLFFKSIAKTNVSLDVAENMSLALDAILGSLTKNKLSMKTGKELVSLSGGLWVLGKAISAISKMEKGIERGGTVLANFADKLAEKYSSRRVRKTVSSIKVLAVGIATLGLAISAFALISPLAVVAAGALAIFGIAVRKTVASKKTTIGLAIFTTSLAMLGVSLWAFSEVAAQYLPSVIGGLALLGGAIWLLGNGGKFGKISLTGKPPYKVLGYLAVGLATLGLAIWAWQELGLTGEGTALVAGGIAMLAGATWVMSKIDSPKTQTTFMVMALGVGVLGGAIWVWGKAGITWDQLAIVAAGVGGLAIVTRLVANVPITASVNMLLMATGVAALGGAIWVWTKSGVTWDLMGMIGVGIAGLAIAAYALGNPIALLGAATMAVLSVGLIAISGAMSIIAKSDITVDTVTEFTKSLNIITLGFAALAIPAVPAAVTSVMLIPVAVSSLTMAGIFALLSNIKINQDRIKIFGKSINILVDAYDDLGLIKTGKAALKAVACIPIATSSIATATAIRILQMLNLDQDRISQNADAMGMFLIKMTDVFSDVGPRIEKVKSGVAAVGNLANVIKSLADAVLTVSKMEYPENKIVNGKIVPVALRKLTDKDFDNVGVGIGKMLNALIDPLITIGSAQETYTIGGFTIQNPFGSGNKVKKGINAIKGIGEIFTPLANVVKAITETGALGKDGQEAATKLQTIIGSMLKAIGDSVVKLSGIKFEDADDLKKSIEGITTVFKPIGNLLQTLSQTGILSNDNKDGAAKLNTTLTTISNTIVAVVTKLAGVSGENSKLESVTKNLSNMFAVISKADATGITKIREEVDKLYKKLSNVKPWNAFRINFREYTKSAGQIVRHINGLELEKAVLLSEMVKDLKDADENGNIERLIEKIKELIGQMAENQQQMQELQETTNNIINNQTTNNTTEVKGNDGKPVPTPQIDKPVGNEGAILSELRRISSRLNSKLIVSQAATDTWKVRNA